MVPFPRLHFFIPEVATHCEVPAMSWVTSAHHVLGVKHLLGKFRYCQGAVLLGATAGERSKTRNEEVKTGERNHVDSKFPQIRVKLTWESQTCGHSRKSGRYKMIQISICRGGKF